MTARHPYDAARRPPAPVLPARVGRPGQEPSVLLAFLVDTGADVSVVPDGVARDLRLPVVGQIAVRGITGPLRSARVYAAEVEAGGGRNLVEVVGMGGDALIGRDLLNQWTVTLRGPRLVMDVVIGSGA